MVKLLSVVGGDGDNFTATIRDDEAAQSIAFAGAPCTGRFQPKGVLRDFDGKDITGIWALHVTDRVASGHGGALIQWSLVIELMPEPEGNLNHDGNLDATDIDVLFANLGSSDPTYELNGDTVADRQDIRRLVASWAGGSAMRTWIKELTSLTLTWWPPTSTRSRATRAMVGVAVILTVMEISTSRIC